MLNKFKERLLLLFVLLIFSVGCGVVSAHDGDHPPEISVVTPQNNKTVSGNVNLEVSLDHSHTGVPNTLNITISSQNGYNKKIQLSGSHFNSGSQSWKTSWDTSDASNGVYTMKAECADIYGVGSSTVNVIVNNQQKATKVELNNFKGINNHNTVISATLKDSSNLGISNKIIQFNISGKIYTAATDNGGIAKITYKGTSGNYNVIAKFLGDSNYASSEKTSILNIVSSGNILTITSITADKGKVIQLKSSLINSSNNKPVSGQSVRFTVNNKYIGSNVTNKNGVAVFNYKTSLNGGKYSILGISGDGMVGSGILMIRQSSMYLKITTDNIAPSVGDKFTLYYRIINNGPYTSTNTVFSYKIPKGFIFVKASKNAGSYKYNAKTRIVTWKLPSAKVGVSLLKITVRLKNSGTFLLRPKVTTKTYDTSIKNSLSNIYLRTVADLSITKVKRKGNSYKVTIKNKGGIVSKSTYFKIFYKVGKKSIVKKYKIKGIGVGKSITINAKFFRYSKHKRYVKTAHVNYNKKIKESNYNNNKKKFKA